jgi:hypothetical protein
MDENCPNFMTDVIVTIYESQLIPNQMNSKRSTVELPYDQAFKSKTKRDF